MLGRVNEDENAGNEVREGDASSTTFIPRNLGRQRGLISFACCSLAVVMNTSFQGRRKHVPGQIIKRVGVMIYLDLSQ